MREIWDSMKSISIAVEYHFLFKKKKLKSEKKEAISVPCNS